MEKLRFYCGKSQRNRVREEIAPKKAIVDMMQIADKKFVIYSKQFHHLAVQTDLKIERYQDKVDWICGACPGFTGQEVESCPAQEMLAK